MHRRTRSAFSLAELMIALAILGIGLLFIAAALPVGISYSRDSVDFAAAGGAADEAFQTLGDLRNSRQLFKNPLVPVGGTTPVAVYPARTNNPFYPNRLDNLFRPRHSPRGGVIPVPDPYPPVLEPREGSCDHPYPDPVPGPPPVRGDTRDDGYEPFIKVRPLTMPNLSAGRRGSGSGSTRDIVMDDGEEMIGQYLFSVGLHYFTAQFPQPFLEFDAANLLRNANSSGVSAALIDNPPFSPLLRFFPAVTPNVPFRAERFAPTGVDPESNAATRELRYWSRNIPNAVNDQFNYPTGYAAAEFDKAAERRISWTTFYRRMQYDEVRPGPDGNYNGPPPLQGPVGGDDQYYPADRQLYEMIVVVTRRPSTRHRFARQFLPTSPLPPGNFRTFERPTAEQATVTVADIRGGDRVAPTPWLVIADTLIAADNNAQQGGTPPHDGIMQGLLPVIGTAGDFFDLTRAAGTMPALGWSRALRQGFPERSTLKFRVTTEVGRLVATGSVMIPAANDNYPHNRAIAPGTGNFATPNNRVAGFVPHTPDALPIYEVLEVIPDDLSVPAGNRGTTIVVKKNGSYPWVGGTGTAGGNNAATFPFWVIPPSFAERDANGDPIFERTSPIIGVYRKIIRVSEVP